MNNPREAKEACGFLTATLAGSSLTRRNPVSATGLLPDVQGPNLGSSLSARWLMAAFTVRFA
jgi:hypothetical protein